MRPGRLLTLLLAAPFLAASIAAATQEGSAAFVRHMLERTGSAEHPCVLNLDGAGPGTVFVCAKASTDFSAFRESWDREASQEGVGARPLADWTTGGGSRMRWYQYGDRWVVVTFDGAAREVVLSYPRDRAGVAVLTADIRPPRRIQPGSGSGEERAQARRGVRPDTSGVVVVSAIVRENGAVGDVEVLGCLPRRKGLEEAAIQAVKAWRYDPAEREGVPVSVAMTATITYGPGDSLEISAGGSASSSTDRSPQARDSGLP